MPGIIIISNFIIEGAGGLAGVTPPSDLKIVGSIRIHQWISCSKNVCAMPVLSNGEGNRREETS